MSAMKKEKRKGRKAKQRKKKIEKRKGYKWQVISISAGGAIVLSDRATTNVKLMPWCEGSKKERKKKKKTVEVKSLFFLCVFVMDGGWKCSANHRDLF